jgi:hypothetical protein
MRRMPRVQAAFPEQRGDRPPMPDGRDELSQNLCGQPRPPPDNGEQPIMEYSARVRGRLPFALRCLYRSSRVRRGDRALMLEVVAVPSLVSRRAIFVNRGHRWLRWRVARAAASRAIEDDLVKHRGIGRGPVLERRRVMFAIRGPIGAAEFAMTRGLPDAGASTATIAHSPPPIPWAGTSGTTIRSRRLQGRTGLPSLL